LPDLVILDVMMPGMSGWEVCRKIREAVSLAHTGVIMLTGIGENLNEMTSPLYGADTYLDKPFEFSLLDEKVKEVLATRRQEHAMGRPDPELAARKSSRPPAPKTNGLSVEGAVGKSAKKKESAPKPGKTEKKTATGAKPLVKAAPRKAAAEPAKKAKTEASGTKAKAAPKKAAAKKAAPKKAAAKKAAPKPAKKSAAKKASPKAVKAAPKAAPKKAAPKAKKIAAAAAPAPKKAPKAEPAPTASMDAPPGDAT
jgi:hypothetical protein